jgi:hypothetical protein
MVASRDLSESNGAGPTVTDAVTNVNMGSNDSYNLVALTYPITAGTNSFEKWHRIKVTAAGGSSSLNNWKVWASNTMSANCTLKTNCRETSYGGAQTYNTASATDRSGTYGYTQTMPTSTPTNSNLGYGGTLGAAMDITSGLPKYTDYIVMQIQTTGSATIGTSFNMNYQYDETA